jgi:hypothetical protein
MSRGYVIVAENTDDVDYVRCATVLASSLKRTMPGCSVTLLGEGTSKYFDHVIPPVPIDTIDPFKIGNDCQVYALSPYDLTIKLEADLFMSASIDHWWPVLESRDLVVCTTIRDYKGQVSHNRTYRRFIEDNRIPNVYNAITYFKKSALAEEYYAIVRDIAEHWPTYRALLQCRPDEPVTTDWAYALAAHILTPERTTLPTFEAMSMTHMKQAITGSITEDWSESMVTEPLPHCLRIQTYAQTYPFHYHSKQFCATLERVYG